LRHTGWDRLEQKQRRGRWSLSRLAQDQIGKDPAAFSEGRKKRELMRKDVSTMEDGSLESSEGCSALAAQDH